MLAIVCIGSKNKNELNEFLSKYFESNLIFKSKSHWKKQYNNPRND